MTCTMTRGCTCIIVSPYISMKPQRLDGQVMLCAHVQSSFTRPETRCTSGRPHMQLCIHSIGLTEVECNSIFNGMHEKNDSNFESSHRLFWSPWFLMVDFR